MALETTTGGDDPVLARLRALALAFPGAAEVETHGQRAFRAGRLFAVCGTGEKGRAHPRSVAFRPEEDERAALAQDPRVFVPAYYGAAGWLGLDLDDADWQEVAELLDSSFRAVAPPALVARLEAEGGPAGVPHATGTSSSSPPR